MNDGLEIKGMICLTLLSKKGKVKVRRYCPQIVTTAGREHIADLLQTGTIANIMSQFAVGTSSATPAVGNTELGDEAARKAASVAQPAATQVAYTAQFTNEITQNASIWEAGIFNHTATGDMLMRGTLTQVVNFQTGDTLNASYTVTIGT